MLTQRPSKRLVSTSILPKVFFDKKVHMFLRRVVKYWHIPNSPIYLSGTNPRALQNQMENEVLLDQKDNCKRPVRRV